VRELVPRFVLERVAEGADEGELPSAAVYVDLVGFTGMADGLARHGAHGAEVLADIVAAVLAPVIDAVYAQTGFVASFGGDSFVALFADDRRALAAADAITEAIRGNGTRATPYGPFAVHAKVGAGAGRMRWRVLRAPDDSRLTYAFSGSAIERAVSAEKAAGRGELVLDPSISEDAGALPEPVPFAVPTATHPLADRFNARDLLEWTGPGEFRPVLPVFIGLPAERLDAVVRACAAAGVPCRFVRRETDLEPSVILGSAAE
jgi:class 3 adenylate cyclase